MKLRLRPLRGQTYGTYRKLIFLDYNPDFKITDAVVVLEENKRTIININFLNLPIIDTKDYEKIEDRKYKGD